MSDAVKAMALRVWMLVGLAAALSCPKARCGTQQQLSTSCVEFSGEYMDLYQCTPAGDWLYTCAPEQFVASTRGPRSTVFCSLDRFERKSNSTNQDDLEGFMDEMCGNRMNVRYEYSLASGSHPKLCTSDMDCRLINGEQTTCQCGPNALGQAYCAVHLYDPVVMSMYDLACMEDLGNFYAEYLGWLYYPQTQDEISCAKATFSALDAASRGNNSLSTWYLTLSEGRSLSPFLVLLAGLSLL